MSHGLAQINDLCDETLWLDKGAPQMLGPSRQVTKAYLDSVNAKEVAHRDAAQTHSESSTASDNRRGTGSIRVTALDLLGADGAPASVLVPGDRLTIRLKYRAAERVEDVTFGIAVENSAGITVMSSGSSDESAWHVEPGIGEVEYRMDECLLAPGSYTLKTAITAEGSTVDADDAGVSFAVRPGAIQVGGVYLQPGAWSIAVAR